MSAYSGVYSLRTRGAVSSGLCFVHQDDRFVVVNKPSGVLSVPGRGIDKLDSIETRLKQVFPGCINQPAVHRLDMDTSGLLLLALDVRAHRKLSMQFEQRIPKKEYVALLDGRLDQERGRIELPFRLDIDNRPIQIYDPVHGKMGVTEFERLGFEGPYTRVLFKPHTGRTHQLRVHAAHKRGLGLPIVGDPFYGHGAGPGQLKLHASTLSFLHPETDEELSFRCAAPF